MLPFICYLTRPDDTAPVPHPAARRRDWMNRTKGAFAYRCLPLVMANQHGWEMRAPFGFTAEWDGGASPEAMTVRADDGAALDGVSHFGSGILSFQFSMIFRTPPGYNLWLTGPANRFKDGIQCLSALIETDWMPYSFSVNWKFTRAGHPVAFEKGEPICQIFPVPRGLVEQFAPEVRDLATEPELERQHRVGVLRRRAPDIRQAMGSAADPALDYQGWYMRGVNPDESGGFGDHQTSLDVRPFRRANGSGDEG